MSNRLKVVDILRPKPRPGDTATISRLRVIYDDKVLFEAFTIEQPWLQNAPYESCIPVGLYKLKLGRFNAGGYAAYEVMNVPGRTYIKIHIGNTVLDILGCICLGDAITEFPNGIPGVLNSSDTFKKFMEVMDGDKEAWLSVREES